ncbi:gamma-glutamyl-gamma-aminobutyrate hydrolase family protein [Acidisoma sp. 7E03]
MTLVALTMQQSGTSPHGEAHDSLDQRWFGFLRRCKCTPLLLPNCLILSTELVSRFAPNAVILTGGGNIVAIDGRIDERQRVESFLLRWATENRKTIIGVCRGMQAILTSCGAKLQKVDGHVRTRHRVLPSGRVVNSFHRYGFAEVPQDFRVLQRAEDGVVESCTDSTGRVFCIMWHPEREEPLDVRDEREFCSRLNGCW